MNKKPTPKAKAPAKKPAPKAAPAPVQKAALKAPGRKPFEAPGTGRKPFERFDDVAADLQEIRLRFIDMHNVRPVLACKGKVTAMESEEIGFLFARVLDDLDMPVPWEYSGFDPYQRDDVPLPDRVDFGPRKQPANEVENALLNALLTIRMRRVARDPVKLRTLYVALQNDINLRVWYRCMLGEMARLATAMPGAH